MKSWKGNGNTTTLQFSLKILEIVQNKRTIEHHSDVTLQKHSLPQIRTR